jgi:hypothetical protein
MNEQEKTRIAALEASQARVEQNASELQQHAVAGAALTEAANREVAQANAIAARMASDRDALAANKVAVARQTSARNAMVLYMVAGLLIVILAVGGIYFYLHK